ncbi:MAG TPA: Sec-independent protein translocase protein TatB [Xanthobacteraceae bacterium]|nr:Sec-independent protein translocase protein TatB [Xanthobacteraceae bacterium]
MFDIGWSELLIIGVVALIVIGPKELPGVLRSVGYWMGKVRRMASEFQSQFQEAMREAEMADLKKHADDLNQNIRSLTSDIDPYNIARDVEASLGSGGANGSGSGVSPAPAPSTDEVSAAAPEPAAAPQPTPPEQAASAEPAAATEPAPPAKGAA